MKQEEIIKRKNQTLTNKFTGMSKNSVRHGVKPIFQFEIENLGDFEKRVALIPAYFNTSRIVHYRDMGGNIIHSEILLDDPSKLNQAGFSVDAVLCDTERSRQMLQQAAQNMLGVSEENEEGEINRAGDDAAGLMQSDIKMRSIKPTKTIENFRRYMLTNPTPMKRLQVRSEDRKAFDTELTITTADPFNNNKEICVDLSTFFSTEQFQGDRITIDFTGDELELSDVSVVILTVQPRTKMRLLMGF